MTVKEFIERLKELDDHVEIYIETECGLESVADIEEYIEFGDCLDNPHPVYAIHTEVR